MQSHKNFCVSSAHRRKKNNESVKKNVNVMSVMLMRDIPNHNVDDANIIAETKEVHLSFVMMYASADVTTQPKSPSTTGVNLPANSFCPNILNDAAVSQ